MTDTISAAFHARFGAAPQVVVRAPGRLNLIGEHTDYNDGLVLPAAIDRAIYFAVSLTESASAELVAVDLGETHTAPLPVGGPGPVAWANYLLGVIAGFQARGVAVPGLQCVFGGDVPEGAGLSSSAALECGLAVALDALLRTQVPRLELALLAQQAEHTYAGVRSGLMDQFASLFGRAAHVVRFDCRSHDYAYFPFDTAAYRLILCNSGVKHALASSAYNQRRQECEAGVAILQRHHPNIHSLRDATLAQLDAHRAALGPVIYRRCAYVVAENARVAAACTHLLAGDVAAVGPLLYATHAGLRDDYEVSCAELDFLVDTARPLPGVLGARLMGGGFGGCTLNLMAPEAVSGFIATMQPAYEAHFGEALEVIEVALADGAGVVVTSD